jgi:hypothetical protein
LSAPHVNAFVPHGLHASPYTVPACPPPVFPPFGIDASASPLSPWKIFPVPSELTDAKSSPLGEYRTQLA